MSSTLKISTIHRLFIQLLLLVSVTWIICLSKYGNMSTSLLVDDQQSKNSVRSLLSPSSSQKVGCNDDKNNDRTLRIGSQHQNQQQKQQQMSTMQKSSSSSSHNFTVAICLITSDGEQYFQEWVDYHLLGMGFNGIYVYDNSDGYDLRRWYDNTRSHPIYSTVEITHRPGPGYDKKTDRHLQNIVYDDCIKRYGTNNNGPQHDYFALIDIDEFLVPQQDKYESIHDVLEEYLVPFGGALVSNWVLFGSANKTVYSPVPVTKRFQYRDVETHNVVKSIVKATDYVTTRNPHAVKLKNVTNVHTSEFPGAIQANVFDPKDRTKASSWAKASDVLLVHHYRYTSDKEYYYKRCVRDGLVGRWCDRSTNTLKTSAQTPDHIQSRPGELFDDRAWRILTSSVSKYQVYDTPDWEDFF